jgi:hypothetical protein
VEDDKMGLTTMLVLLPFYLQLLLLLKNPLLLLPTIPFFETIPLSLSHKVYSSFYLTTLPFKASPWQHMQDV